MSNRENLRRIAALSLVIAFGMSGAAGLAEGTSNVPAERIDEENELRVELSDAYDYDSYYVANNKTHVYTYGYDLVVLDGNPLEFTEVPFWHFYLGDKEIGYTIESNNDGVTYSQPVATNPNFKATFSKGGMYTFTIKAEDQENGPTINLRFTVIEKTTPASAELGDIPETSLTDFEKVEGKSNTYKYKNPLSFKDDGSCTVAFNRFWTFLVGEEKNVTDDAPMNNDKVELHFVSDDGNSIERIVHAKVDDKIYADEKDEVLTLVFDVADYVAPFGLEFAEDQDKFTIDTKEGKTTAIYNDTVKIIDDAPTTVLFNKFWEFTGEGVTEKHDDRIEEAQATDSDVGTKYDYKVTFGKESKEGIHAFTVRASQVEGTITKDLSFDINFNVEKVYTAKLSEIADTSIPSNFKRSDVDNTFICTDELLLEDGSVRTSVFPFWGFTINGEYAAFTGNYYTCDGEEVNVDANGFIFKSEGTHTVKVYADKDHTGEGNDFVTLIFEVTEPEPEIKHSELDVSDSHEGFELGAGFKVPTYLYATELVPDKDGTCTATFKKFWNFKVDDEAVTGEEYSYNDDDEIKIEATEEEYTVTLTNVEPGLHSVDVRAKGYTTEEDGVITLVFSVAEAEPEIENAELVIAEDKLGNFKAVEGATNTYAYPELTLSEDGSYTVEYDHFWSFSIKGTDTSIDTENIVISEDDGISAKCENEKCTFTFSKASGENPFEVKIYAQKDDDTLYNGEDDDFLTLNFTVKPAPEKTKEPDYPYYPPVDPVTPVPTATPTATPAPTETPAPTDAPTDAPTSEPTAKPDVEMQVSAGGKRLNVRSGAGIGNNIVARLNDGSKVTVLLVEGDWSYIRATVNSNVVEGYVSSQYLKEISTVEPTEPANARVSTSGSALRLRASASLNAPIITRMPNGSSLKVLETVNGWCRVQFTAANGTVHEGWASSQYITVIA